MIPRFTICKVVAVLLCILSAQAAFCRINIALTAAQVLVNGLPVDSTTPVYKVRQVTGADCARVVSWGDLGVWYIYDAAGVAFRWSPDTSRLICITTEYHSEAPPVWRPAHDMAGTLSYLGTPLAVTNNIWTVLRRATGHVVSIAPDLYSVCIAQGAYDVQVCWRGADCEPPGQKNGAFTMLTRQTIASCWIYLTAPTDTHMHHPLVARGQNNKLLLSGRLAPDTLFREGDFVTEGNPCKTDFLMVEELAPLEAAFSTDRRDSLDMLVVSFRATLQQNNFTIAYGDNKEYSRTYGEDDINRDGYKLIKYGHFAGAEALLRLNTELFSTSYNARDSYAEALLDDSRPYEASLEYVLAMSFNPHDAYYARSTYYNSKRMLRFILGHAPAGE